MTKTISASTRLCDDMVAAGITSAGSSEGRKYCTDHCPQEECIFEGRRRGGPIPRPKRKKRQRDSLAMWNKGFTTKEIAKHFNVTTGTVRSDLARSRKYEEG